MKKTFKHQIIMAGAFITMLVGSEPVSAANYHTMVCRTGGSMKMILTSQTNGTEIDLRISKARQGYLDNRDGLRLGECAWLRRPLNVSEPTLLRKKYAAYVKISSGLGHLSHTETGVLFSQPETREETRASRFLATIRGRDGRGSGGGLITLRVKNTNHGYFEIGTLSAGGPSVVQVRP